MNPSDFDIEALKALNGSEWERLETRYHDRIWGYVRRQIGHVDAADDLTQDVFLGALRGIASFDTRYNVEQFLMGIARNKVIDHLRKKRLEVQVADRDEDSSGFFGNRPGVSLTSQETLAALEKLGRQRDALVECLHEMVQDLIGRGEYHKLMTIELSFLTDRRHRDIADRVGITDEKAIAGIKFRAIRDLQSRLRRRDPRKTLFSGLWESL